MLSFSELQFFALNSSLSFDICTPKNETDAKIIYSFFLFFLPPFIRLKMNCHFCHPFHRHAHCTNVSLFQISLAGRTHCSGMVLPTVFSLTHHVLFVVQTRIWLMLFHLREIKTINWFYDRFWTLALLVCFIQQNCGRYWANPLVSSWKTDGLHFNQAAKGF